MKTFNQKAKFLFIHQLFFIFHYKMSKEIQKHIQDLFKIDELLGSGAYGHVWKVTEKTTQKTYALKKVFDAFQNDVDAQRTYRQITILHQLNHTNIIKLQGVIKAKNDKDLYLVFQHMQTDLHSLVGENVLETAHLLYIIYQIFKALKYLHSAQLVHRDLKPSNVLINSDCEIKLCDFGLVRSLTHQEDSRLILSEDVATRWYRSPEMLLGSQQYDWATDVWSIGCVLGELISGEPLLMGGSNIQQLEKILELTGIPKSEDIQSIKSDVAQSLINQFKTLKRPFKHYFNGCKYETESGIINLIKRMLEFNPQKRITVEEVLSHEILSEVKQKKQETSCQKVVIPEVDDNVRLTVDQYRKAIYKDIQRRYPKYNIEKLQNQQQIQRYSRGHNSLFNRTSSINSLTRVKACNSLMRPARTKGHVQNKSVHVSQAKNKSVQHQSLHCNTVHNSLFYKTCVSKKNIPAANAANSLHSSVDGQVFNQISANKDKNEYKISTDVSTVIQKSPFRRYKNQIGHQNPLKNIGPIEGLNKQKSLQRCPQKKGRAQKQNSNLFECSSSKNSLQTFTKYMLGKSSGPSSSAKGKSYIYDPSSVYNNSPPKGHRSKQKNLYETMAISNSNKITKKSLKRNVKQFLFYNNGRDKEREAENNNSGISSEVMANQ